MKTIYFDNAATTKVHETVVKKISFYLKNSYGNASSLHSIGQEAFRALEESRKIIASSINAEEKEIIFTSGGTESNNLAIKGIAYANPEKKHIVTSKIEHSSILNICKELESRGWKITYLDVDSEGFIDLEQLKESITNETILVSIIHANNEIGTIQNIAEIGKICSEKEIYFHTDACQSYMKEEIDIKKQNLDLVTLNAHKIHGPKGVGALYVKKGIKIIPQQLGSQEFKMRGGTENIPGIVGFAEAVKIFDKKSLRKIERIRNYIIKELKKIKNSRLNGSEKSRLSNNVNFSFFGIEGEGILSYLNLEGICCSTGSACSSKSLEPSHVLLAIGLKPEEAHGSIRVSLSKYNTLEEAKYFVKKIKIIVNKLREMSPISHEK